MAGGGVAAYPPGPRGFAVFGFLGGGSAARTIAFLQETARRFGPVSSFRILGRRMYLIDEPELIEEVLVNQQHRFVRDTGATLLRELLGDGLLTSDEPRHRERRRILQPAFHRDQIASYAATMVAESERMALAWEARSTVNIGMEMRKLTLSIVGACLFGSDFRDRAEQVAAVLRRVVRRVAWLAPAFVFLEPVPLLYRRVFPRGPSLFFRSARAELERIVSPIIDQRRTTATADLISVLLRLRDDANAALGEDDVRNEAVTLVLAGHETTAAALTWTWFLIAQHPDVERRFHAELDEVLGDRRAGFEDAARLRYTSMIFREATRLYPPALVFGRRPVESTRLGGYAVPRGASVLLSPYITQRNGRFFRNPDIFDPSRWETEAPPKFAYFPFGGGAKICLGEPFARLEAVLALATLGRKWRLSPLEEQPAGLVPRTALVPKRDIVMRPMRRGHAAPAI